MCFYTPCDNQTNECVNSSFLNYFTNSSFLNYFTNGSFLNYYTNGSFLNYYTEMLMHLVFGACIYLHKYWLVALRKNLKKKREITSIDDVNNLLSGADDADSVAYKNISALINGEFVMAFDHIVQYYKILMLLKSKGLFDIGSNNFLILQAFIQANKIRQYKLCIACNLAFSNQNKGKQITLRKMPENSDQELASMEKELERLKSLVKNNISHVQYHKFLGTINKWLLITDDDIIGCTDNDFNRTQLKSRSKTVDSISIIIYGRDIFTRSIVRVFSPGKTQPEHNVRSNVGGFIDKVINETTITLMCFLISLLFYWTYNIYARSFSLINVSALIITIVSIILVYYRCPFTRDEEAIKAGKREEGEEVVSKIRCSDFLCELAKGHFSYYDPYADSRMRLPEGRDADVFWSLNTINVSYSFLERVAIYIYKL